MNTIAAIIDIVEFAQYQLNVDSYYFNRLFNDGSAYDAYIEQSKYHLCDFNDALQFLYNNGIKYDVAFSHRHFIYFDVRM